ncbi:MAG: penicillin acylase family protein [Erythrobacter sp.]|uniref:penicillin acylase family protein n=1 Tax=Erythrobacter sp. TaxID=1042 RepID=UPI00261CB450|nr:penicillin acylase family protein [Erythrobacter sp.]MDJ0977686.1 penicillin acylase family protein [Erythrobacter sp.]
MRHWALGLAALAASAAGTAATAQTTYEATITRTTYGIPHISADTWQGVGYGVGYAYAQDNICMLAEEFVTVGGERSLYFGPEGKTVLGFSQTDNVTSDLFFRSQFDIAQLRANMVAHQHLETIQVLAGYVAGYNRYLRDTPREDLPEACRDKAWVRPITIDDALRLTEKQMLLASSLALAPGIAGAAPPGETSTAVDFTLPDPDEPRLGSNGWAFGGEATANARGLLIGNPHFPWEGPSRFWQMHVRGPDGYDVMGVGIAGTPLPTLGFNKDVAWTHTVTAARHFTVYALTLSPDDPTVYMVDGEPVKMEAREVTVPMPEGTDPVVRTFYSTRFGRIATVPGTPFQWSNGTAFAIRDANTGNQRALEAWLGIGRAASVAEIETAISETLGIPWVNTIAADREGNALHADITAVPNVTKSLVELCATPFTALVADRVTLLDGTRSECDWKTRETTAPFPGLLPANQQASRTRADYVTNSNDSYWISNASRRYEELAPILGPHSNPLSLRTRSNFKETEAFLAQGKMDHARAKALTFGNKSLAAEMVVEPLIGLCENAQGLDKACAALSGWDRLFENDSKGAYLFVKFWNKIRGRNDLWSVPFDADKPLTTPRTLVTEGEAAEAMLTALGEAAAEIEAEGLALDAVWGEVQTRADGQERIAIHGGPGTLGVLNFQRSRVVEGGLTPVHGSSYIQIVGFDEDGPVADAILSYSQSTNPASPHYSDQTRNYSAKQWHRLPFSDAEIEAAQIGERLTLSE